VGVIPFLRLWNFCLLSHPILIFPAEWSRTPASVQRLIEQVLFPKTDQSPLGEAWDLDATLAEVTHQLAGFHCRMTQYRAAAGRWRTVVENRPDPTLPSALGSEISDGDNPFSAPLRSLQTMCLDNTVGWRASLVLRQAPPGPGC
jgi:hypothetical protein